MGKKDAFEPLTRYLNEGKEAPNPAIKFPDAPNTHCCVCGTEILVQIYKNSGICSEQHRKDRDNDHGPARVGYVSGS